MKIGLLTSVDIRHRYFAQTIRARFDVVAVGHERTGYDPTVVCAAELTAQESDIVRAHFDERSRQELLYFGHRAEFVRQGATCAARMIQPGELNSPGVLEFLGSRGVDTVVVYGTNLIKEPLLSAWPGRIINLHLGLSPYYRGTATNFYPLLNEEPEYVGATIHLIDAGIDSGPILRHARPAIVADDAPHTIGCKTILAGIDALIGALHEIEAGRPRPIPQWKPKNARLYLRKDYHPRQVVDLYRKLEDGLIGRYLGRLARGEAEIRLVNAKDIQPGSSDSPSFSSLRANAVEIHCEFK